jgi:hypothetical protein
MLPGQVHGVGDSSASLVATTRIEASLLCKGSTWDRKRAQCVELALLPAAANPTCVCERERTSLCVTYMGKKRNIERAAWPEIVLHKRALLL